jgi:uncharacterized protein
MSEQTLTPPVIMPARQGKLGRDLIIDILVLVVAVLIISVVIPVVFLAAHALQTGGGLSILTDLQADELLAILGVPGIFVLLLLQNFLFSIVPIARVRWWRRESFAMLGFTLPAPARNIGLGIILGIGIIIANALLGLAFAALGMRQNQAAQYPLFAGDYLGQIAFFIGAAIIVPIGEEIFFRGYLFKTLWRIWEEKPWGRVAMFVVSSLAFSLAHAAAASQDVIALLVPAFMMGVLLAYAMYRTGSIVPSIIAHAMNNGLALLALLTCVNNPSLCPNI